MPTVGMARMGSFCRASPEAEILQTLSEESISLLISISANRLQFLHICTCKQQIIKLLLHILHETLLKQLTF